ncbi:MAG: DUF2339 domain-containing protein [Patescibacteria group bacterium]
MIAIIIVVVLYLTTFQDLKKRMALLENKVKRLELGNTTPTQSAAASTAIPSITAHSTVQAYIPQAKKPDMPKPEAHPENFGSVLAKIGIAILVLGIAFFLNYINSIGLLGNNTKFVMGLLAGGAMIGIAEYVKTKTLHYAQILRGGGIIVWYLTIFVGSMIYHIVSLPFALTLTIGVAVVSLLISLREKTETTFLIGTLGAYLVPLICGFYAQDAVSLIQVLLYVCVINVGIVIVAKKQDWMRSIGIGFLFSWLVLFSFYGNIATLGWATTWMATTICALTFLIVFVLGDIKRSRESTQTQTAVFLTVLNTCIYALTAYNILHTTPLAPYLGFLIAVLGAVHLCVYMYIRNVVNATDHPSALTHLVLFITLITAAVPVQFDGAVVTMIWFVEGIVLSYLATLNGFKGKMIMYILGFAGIIAGIIHMIMFGTYEGVYVSGVPFLNQKYLVWLFVIILVHAIAYIWKSSIKDQTLAADFRKSIWSSVLFLVVLAQAAFLGLSSLEIHQYASYKTQQVYAHQQQEREYYGDAYEFDPSVNAEVDTIQKTASFMNIVFFIIMTVLYLLIGLRKNNTVIRSLGIVTLVITLLQLFVFTWGLGQVYRIISFVGFGVILLIVSYMYVQHNKKNTPLPPVALMLLATLSLIGATTHAAVVNPVDFSSVVTFTQPSQTAAQTSDTWYVSSLDADIWTKSKKADFSDIRIVNKDNVEIPYVLVKQGTVAKTEPTISNDSFAGVKIIENTIQKYENKADRVVVLDSGKEGQVYTGITLQKTPDSKNFRKITHVYVSDSLLGASSPTWREVEQRSVVYNYTDPVGFVVENLEMRFPNMASRYIKIQFEEDTSLNTAGVTFTNQINITGARITYDMPDKTTGTQIKNYLAGNFDLDADAEVAAVSVKSVNNDDKKTTELLINNVQAITSIKLSVDADEVNFKRDVTVQTSSDGVTWQTISSGQIYRIDSPVYKGENTTISLPVTTAPFMRVVVQNKSDTALTFEKQANVTAQKVGILFKVEGREAQTFKLLIGNESAIIPVYDIQKTLSYFGNTIPTQIDLTNIGPNPLFKGEAAVPFTEKYPYMVNAALVFFVLVLGFLGYKWTKKA